MKNTVKYNITNSNNNFTFVSPYFHHFIVSVTRQQSSKTLVKMNSL